MQNTSDTFLFTWKLLWKSSPSASIPSWTLRMSLQEGVIQFRLLHRNEVHQKWCSKDRVPLLHYTIDGRAKLSRPLIWGPNCSVRRPSQGQLGGCLTVGQAPQIVSFHENMVGECLCRLWKPAGTESNHGSCMFHEANGRFQAQCACKGPLSSIHQRWQTFIQMHPCLYTWNYMKFVGFVRQRT